ncbi:MAG TPA: TadE/TadG family type IV pilus assembly protein [Gemmataceae bacterium]|jgi:Flp pilus assembly protein TadG|nr:TadE/TadG family type IV pilus assembly protein [Gemmataceae bacterium]
MRKPNKPAHKAAAAVELAVLLPVIVFLFVITVDFARIFYFSQVIENCARQGALYASDPKAPAANLYDDLTDAALADAPSLSPAPTVTSANGTDAAGNAWVSVTVQWQFQTITSYPGIPTSVTLSRTVQMRSAP